MVAANWQPDWPTVPGSTERNSPSSPAKSSCALVDRSPGCRTSGALRKPSLAQFRLSTGCASTLRVSSEKLMAAPAGISPSSRCTSGCWASDRLTPAILGRGPATCKAPGKRQRGLNILHVNAGGQQFSGVRRGLELDRRFALHQIVRVGLHRAKVPDCTGSGDARDAFESRPPQNHGLLGFAQVGAQRQAIERGIGRMNLQRNVVRRPVRLRQNQMVAARPQADVSTSISMLSWSPWASALGQIQRRFPWALPSCLPLSPWPLSRQTQNPCPSVALLPCPCPPPSESADSWATFALLKSPGGRRSTSPFT